MNRERNGTLARGCCGFSLGTTPGRNQTRWTPTTVKTRSLQQSRAATVRACRLGKQGEVRIFYLAYAGTVSHDKLKQLASQGGAAALFSGNAPQGGLAEHVGADQGALAQITQKLNTVADLTAAFARRHQELVSAIADGRDWLGIDHDSLPDR